MTLNFAVYGRVKILLKQVEFRGCSLVQMARKQYDNVKNQSYVNVKKSS